MKIDILNRALAHIIARTKKEPPVDPYKLKLPEGTSIKSRDMTIHVVIDNREAIEQMRADNLSMPELLRDIKYKADRGDLDQQQVSMAISKIMTHIGTSKIRDKAFVSGLVRK